jgi:predicted O-linked N-acetylglucosamine transferase (SPINDLY family)
VDLNGYTDGFRAPIFAHRSAPLQVNFLGYAGTLGASYYDYILADEIVLPPAHRSFYAERVMYLPNCYLPNDPGLIVAEHPPTRMDCGLPEQGFVFCCFNSPHKILPEMFDGWMRLLRAVPGSVLWLAQGRASMVDNLRHEALKRAVSPDRLVFAERVPTLAEHLARYRLADLFLDTLPFNAHTTACDALWAGLPLLTCRGSTFAGQVAASLLTALELPELICDSPADYEALASRLATDPALLAGLRARLDRNRLATSLFDAERYRKNLEAAYDLMLHRLQSGLDCGKT